MKPINILQNIGGVLIFVPGLSITHFNVIRNGQWSKIHDAANVKTKNNKQNTLHHFGDVDHHRPPTQLAGGHRQQQQADLKRCGMENEFHAV